MTRSKSGISKAFLAAPAHVPLDVLKNELLRRAITPLTAYEFPVAGRSILEHVRIGIRDADMVIAVVSCESSPNVFLEIGLAYGLGKDVLVLVSPSLVHVPSDIAGQLYVRADPDNREAIGFMLDQILASQDRKTHRSRKVKSTDRPLGNRAEHYLSRLRIEGHDFSGRELENLVVEALRESGLMVVAQSEKKQDGADIAVWSDDVESMVSNPLIIEVKSDIRSDDQLQRALRQVDKYRLKSNSQWALLLIGTASVPIKVYGSGSVLVLTIKELFEGMRETRFSTTIRLLRNAFVHRVTK